MPLLDHFHESFGGSAKWASVHAMWAAEITGRLNAHWLGPRFAAGPRSTVPGHSEIDIATYEDPPPAAAAAEPGGNGAAAAALSPWAAPAPVTTYPADIPALSEVQVIKTDEGMLVAAIEIVSPGNKDRPAAREGFVGKCLDYLGQGVCVVVIDVVTTYRANLHAEIARSLGATTEPQHGGAGDLYAVTYRPTSRNDQPQIDVWTAPCRVGEPLPIMPLRLTGDTFVPVEFELCYVEACRRLKVLR